MPVKTTKIFLGNLNGKDVYAIGPYAQDIRDIIMSQDREIKELKKQLKDGAENDLPYGAPKL